MKNVNVFEKRNSQISLDSFSVFAIEGIKMNLVRGGGDPIPPPIGGGEPGWQDDDEQP